MTSTRLITLSITYHYLATTLHALHDPDAGGGRDKYLGKSRIENEKHPDDLEVPYADTQEFGFMEHGNLLHGPILLEELLKLNTTYPIIQLDEDGELPPIYLKRSELDNANDQPAKKSNLFSYGDIVASCDELHEEFPTMISSDEVDTVSCINGSLSDSICDLRGTDIVLTDTDYIKCVCGYRQSGIIVIPKCDWRRLVVQNDEETSSTTSSTTSATTATTSTAGTIEVTTSASTTSPTTQLSTSQATTHPHIADGHHDHDHTHGEDEFDTNWYTTPYSSTIRYSVEDSACGQIPAPLNGFLHCVNDRVCSLKCNKGYIPENVREDGTGLSSARMCYVGSTTWSEAPYEKCVRFENFCQYDPTTLQEDPNAIIDVRYNTNERSNNVGKYYINARCKIDSQLFSKIGKHCRRAKCQCKMRRLNYYCVRTSADLDWGVCEQPNNQEIIIL